MKQSGTRFRRDRRGVIAIWFACCSVALLCAVGLAINVAYFTLAKGRLDQAADSAALLATTAVANAVKAGSATAVAQAEQAGQQRFAAQAGTIDNVTITRSALTISQSGTTYTAAISYTAMMAMQLGSIIGVPTVTIAGTSTSSVSVAPYVTIQVLMDVSSSMTIAATPAAIVQMDALTANYVAKPGDPGNVAQSCAFACHWSATETDYYKMALNAGVLLRLTVLQQAVTGLIDQMNTLNTNGLFEIGLDTFNENLNAVYPISANILGVLPAVAQVAPDINMCSSNCPETYFTAAMASVAEATPTSGTGGSKAQAQQYLFIVTDGVVDEYVGSDRVIEPMQASDCAAIKAKGVTVLVLYTPYTPIPTNAFYNEYVAPISPDIVPSLQACASSPTLFYQASDATDVATQLQNMLSTVLQTSSHLTN